MISFQKRHIALAGFFSAISIWVIDAVIDNWWSGEGDLYSQIISPSMREVLERLTPSVFMAAFVVFACIILKNRNDLAAKLKDSLEEIASEKSKNEAELAEKAGQLSSANKDLEAFNSTIAHDLRKPLTIIFTAAQMLKDEYDYSNEQLVFYIKTIIDASERMEEHIEAFQVLARISRHEMSMSYVDLSEIAREISVELQLITPTRTATWEITQGLTAYGDQRLLRVVLENLLGNSWKYAKNQQSAVICFGKTDTPKGEAFYVRDNGAGFESERARELFKPFARLHDDKVFQGTGIGLATVQRIISRHGGEIWGEGVVDKGATFYFTIPERYPR